MVAAAEGRAIEARAALQPAPPTAEVRAITLPPAVEAPARYRAGEGGRRYGRRRGGGQRPGLPGGAPGPAAGGGRGEGSAALSRCTATPRSHRRVAPPPIHFMAESRLYSAPLFLKRRRGRAPGCLGRRRPRHLAAAALARARQHLGRLQRRRLHDARGVRGAGPAGGLHLRGEVLAAHHRQGRGAAFGRFRFRHL